MPEHWTSSALHLLRTLPGWATSGHVRIHVAKDVWDAIVEAAAKKAIFPTPSKLVDSWADLWGGQEICVAGVTVRRDKHLKDGRVNWGFGVEIDFWTCRDHSDCRETPALGKACLWERMI